MKPNILVQPVILSGGGGSRLWPLSREKYPKQLLSLTGSDSLLQATIRRLAGTAGVKLAPALVVCNQEYRFVVAEQLRLIGEAGHLILEPCARNTAPALTLAALAASQNDADPVLLVMPSDHLITNTAAFQQTISQGAALAADGAMVTFGITPQTPQTGYGYIQSGLAFVNQHQINAYSIARFVEKPDLERARSYLQAGNYLWNSGLFMMRASSWLKALGQCRADILAACQLTWQARRSEGQFTHLEQNLFAACPSDSIDYAVMERATSANHNAQALPAGVMLALNAGWSDVGAWDALWQVLPKDQHGNVSQGDVMLHDCHNSLALAESRLLTCVGVRDLVVVETADAVLVAHQTQTQEVKKIAEQLKGEQRVEAKRHRKTLQPWGACDAVMQGEQFQVKHITLKPGASFQTQPPAHGITHWVILKGTAQISPGQQRTSLTLQPGQATLLPADVTHQLSNPSATPLELIEVWCASPAANVD